MDNIISTLCHLLVIPCHKLANRFTTRHSSPLLHNITLVVFIYCLVAGIPLTAIAADPSARHTQLAAAITAELQLHQESYTAGKTYVHWVHLDQDAWVDAIVIFKRHEGSCAFATAKCWGYLVRGSREGYTIVASFLPNHHPFYLGPRSSSQLFRNLYQTGNGENYNEIVFRDGKYQLNRRGLSLGQVKDLTRWSITEAQFDNLAEQTALVNNLGVQVLGAPIDVSIPQPQVALKTEFVRAGHQVANRLKGKLQEVFSRIAAHRLLSHTIHVRLVACEDWITRVPLANQQDRSSRQVVGCLEPLGILAAAEVNEDGQFQTLVYLLTGTLGQALAQQDNLSERLLHTIERDRSLPADTRQNLSLTIHRLPHTWFYLFGHYVVGNIVDVTSLDLAAAQHVASVFRVNEQDKLRNEYQVLKTDIGDRFEGALCAKKLLNDNVDLFEVLNKTTNLLKQGEQLQLALSPLVFIVDSKAQRIIRSPNCEIYGAILRRLSS